MPGLSSIPRGYIYMAAGVLTAAVAIVRGYSYPRGEGSAWQLVRDKEMDLFR